MPKLSVGEFLALVALADDWRVWEYAHLTPEEVPYVLITLADFPPRTGQKKMGKPARLYWLRYIYDSSLRHIEDLWIRPGPRPELFRVSYRPPAGSSAPTLKHLVKSSPVPLEPMPIAGAPPPIPAWVETEVEEWLRENWPDVH